MTRKSACVIHECEAPALLLLEVADGREGLALQARAADERANEIRRMRIEHVITRAENHVTGPLTDLVHRVLRVTIRQQRAVRRDAPLRSPGGTAREKHVRRVARFGNVHIARSRRRFRGEEITDSPDQDINAHLSQ